MINKKDTADRNDPLRLLTLNLLTGKITKHLNNRVSKTSAYIDMPRLRCHFKSSEEYEFNHLGYGWNSAGKCYYNEAEVKYLVVLEDTNWMGAFDEKHYQDFIGSFELFNSKGGLQIAFLINRETHQYYDKTKKKWIKI